MPITTERSCCWFFLLGLLLTGVPTLALAQAPDPADAEPSAAIEPKNAARPTSKELTTDEVKRFLDPTLMISRLEYQFQANFLPGGSELFTHRVRPWFALNRSHAAWVRIPYSHFSFPNGSGPRGIGDISVGWGFLVHENLRRRLTAVAAGVEVLFPTGDATRATGSDRYIVRPSAAIVLNPTDKFPVNLVARYLHSVDGSEREGPDRPVRTVQLELRTFHILPKGFFLAFLPTLFIDLHQDFNVFSFGLGAGRALSARVAIQGAYVEHISGRGTFNRGFAFGLTYLWGKNKEASRPR